MRSLSILVLIIGLLLLVTGYIEQKKMCAKPKIEYRYIPRNFYEEQNSEVDLKSMFSDMFSKQSIWNKYPHGNSDTDKKNTNFID
tara:strand:- start:4663 stop:4917 length:255 start_codon:yes stop_codon:yes gene_type:complete